MVNESECSKKFKKISERCTASAKKEIRIAKEYSKLWTNYSTLNEHINESTKNLNSVRLIAQKKSQKIDAIKQIQKERQEELNKIKDQIQMQEKMNTIQRTESVLEKNKSMLDKLLKMKILKISTKTHISDKSPNVIQGFTANPEQSEVIPFEVDTARRTKDEIEEIIWGNCFRSSEHAKQWEHLFNLSSE